MSKEINLPKSLGELTLKNFLDFTDISKTIDPDKELDSLLKTFKLVEIITDSTEEEVDTWSRTKTDLITTEIKKLIEDFRGFEALPQTHFNINGVDYASRQIDDLDNGEIISLNILKENHANDLHQLYKMLLSILVRPATKQTDKEGIEYWEIEPLNRRDIANLEHRANLFYNNVSADKLIPLISFFLIGSNK